MDRIASPARRAGQIVHDTVGQRILLSIFIFLSIYSLVHESTLYIYISILYLHLFFNDGHTVHDTVA